MVGDGILTYYPQDGFVGAPVKSDPGTPLRQEYGGIPGVGSNTCSFRPMLRLCMQNQYIPLMWGGLTLEFEIASDALEPIKTPATTGRFKADTTSGSWEINDVRMVAMYAP